MLLLYRQDFLTGAYLLTQKDVFLTKADFCRLLAYFSDALEHIDVPPPAILKPRRLWTGKQVRASLPHLRPWQCLLLSMSSRPSSENSSCLTRSSLSHLSLCLPLVDRSNRARR
jgi:DNA-directed RNA polymerase III subunit RPC1